MKKKTRINHDWQPPKVGYRKHQKTLTEFEEEEEKPKKLYIAAAILLTLLFPSVSALNGPITIDHPGLFNFSDVLQVTSNDTGFLITDTFGNNLSINRIENYSANASDFQIHLNITETLRGVQCSPRFDCNPNVQSNFNVSVPLNVTVQGGDPSAFANALAPSFDRLADALKNNSPPPAPLPIIQAPKSTDYLVLAQEHWVITLCIIFGILILFEKPRNYVRDKLGWGIPEKQEEKKEEKKQEEPQHAPTQELHTFAHGYPTIPEKTSRFTKEELMMAGKQYSIPGRSSAPQQLEKYQKRYIESEQEKERLHSALQAKERTQQIQNRKLSEMQEKMEEMEKKLQEWQQREDIIKPRATRGRPIEDDDEPPDVHPRD